MRRGTTPIHTFTCGIDVSQAVEIYITYRQHDKNIIEKTIDDVTFREDNKISVALTQNETLKIKCKVYDESVIPPKEDWVYMQIRTKYADGSTPASNIMSAPPEAILKGGEI